MPIFPISTIFIHNHAPVLENAANIKNAGKYHFAGVSANNRNQSYFIGVFLQTTPIVQKFYNCINRSNTVNTRVRVTHYMIFCKHHLPLPVNPIYYHLLNYPYYTTQDTTIFNTIISILQYCYSYVIHCNYIVTIIISII